MPNAFPPLHLDASIPPVRRTWLWVVAGVSAVLLAGAGVAYSGISTYNDLQLAEARIGYSWHAVINQYTRRSELVPNLVAVVRSYAAHETALFDQIAGTRTRLNALSESARSGKDPQQLATFQAAQAELSGQLGRLLMLAERYPAIQSASLYQDLMVQLEGTENRLAYARQQYFASLADYNLGIRRFPGVLVAGQMGMHERQPLALDDDRVVRPAAPLDLK